MSKLELKYNDKFRAVFNYLYPETPDNMDEALKRTENLYNKILSSGKDVDSIQISSTENILKISSVDKKEPEPKEITLKEKDLFYTSWGYDQTNYEFITVIKISSTGKTAICQRTPAHNEGASGTSNKMKPYYKPFGEKFRMKIRKYRDKITLRGSYPFLHTGTGSKRLDTFYPVVPDQHYYETDSMFGH